MSGEYVYEQVIDGLKAKLQAAESANAELGNHLATVKDNLRMRRPLDGADAQALEGALASAEHKLTIELQRAKTADRLISELTNDRNEWRTQHENLLAMYRAAVAALDAHPPARSPSPSPSPDAVAKVRDEMRAYLGLLSDGSPDADDAHGYASEYIERWATELAAAVGAKEGT